MNLAFAIIEMDLFLERNTGGQWNWESSAEHQNFMEANVRIDFNLNLISHLLLRLISILHYRLSSLWFVTIFRIRHRIYYISTGLLLGTPTPASMDVVSMNANDIFLQKIFNLYSRALINSRTAALRRRKSSTQFV